MNDDLPIPRHEPTIPDAFSAFGTWELITFLVDHAEPIEDEL